MKNNTEKNIIIICLVIGLICLAAIPIEYYYGDRFYYLIVDEDNSKPDQTNDKYRNFDIYEEHIYNDYTFVSLAKDDFSEQRIDVYDKDDQLVRNLQNAYQVKLVEVHSNVDYILYAKYGEEFVANRIIDRNLKDVITLDKLGANEINFDVVVNTDGTYTIIGNYNEDEASEKYFYVFDIVGNLIKKFSKEGAVAFTEDYYLYITTEVIDWVEIKNVIIKSYDESVTIAIDEYSNLPYDLLYEGNVNIRLKDNKINLIVKANDVCNSYSYDEGIWNIRSTYECNSVFD